MSVIQGTGIGLRAAHYQYILTERPDVPWFEVHTENYMGLDKSMDMKPQNKPGGQARYYLEKIREDYPLSFHGVGMSLASADGLDMSYMQRLKQLIAHYQPSLVSDHLSWVSYNGQFLHELLPFPYHQHSLHHLIKKISQAQDILQRELLIENPSAYMSFKASDMSEWEFINQLTEATGCKLLLDVNNIYVSAYNTGLDAEAYIQNINTHSIAEVHLAGYEQRDHYLYDTHGDCVQPAVWDLYKQLLQRTGPLASLIEWDTDLPELSVLKAQATQAEKIQQIFAPANTEHTNEYTRAVSV